MDVHGVDLDDLKRKVEKISEVYTTSIRNLALHFQTLKSARAHRLMMDAPGIYYPSLPMYVISKGGSSTGHRSLNDSILPLLPEGASKGYAFVLYPESYVRTCLDRVLRKKAMPVSPQIRLSMETNFNAKYLGPSAHSESEIAEELIGLLRKDLGIRE